MGVSLRPDADHRIRAGHLWVFSNELQDGFQERTPGELIELLDASGKFVGIGTVNSHSLIAVRLLTRSRKQIDTEFFRSRIRAAIQLRERVYGPSDTAYRLIYSESDGLPGLIVDRFGDVLVVQSLTAGMEKLLDIILQVMSEELHPRGIVLANDSPVREFEGLPLKREIASGNFDLPLRFEQDGITFLSDPISGQKTGFYFDQHLNRRLVQQYLAAGVTVLDLFSYTGAFGLYALKAGASHVTFVDDSEKALGLARQSVSENGWEKRAQFIKQDIFPWLSSVTETYDVVIVDPPALAKSRSKVSSALRAYRDLNARAMARVKPGGLLATSSCSGLVASIAWREALRDAARKAGKRMRIIAQGSQAPDHPILAAMPETEYLKFAIAVVD
jgi:23S rRNA (cytosine1962-C5)-methyltransferase